jgi:membrane AbrB-like protein
MNSVLTTLRPFATALALGLLGGFLFKEISMPLPWMLGPLFAVGLAGIRGIRVRDIRGSRQAGQFVIGCALGLYFTAQVGHQLLDFGLYILAAAFIAILIGALGGLLLKRIAGTSGITSYFASVPGGAAEMAILAERAGARFDQVALAHSIRVLLVVSTVPIAVTLSGASGTDLYAPATTQIVLPGLLALALLATVAACLFRRAGIPNAWLLGPLTVSLLLTLSGLSSSAIPPVLINAAQLFIGCSLGSRFKPSLRTESRRLIIGIVVTAAFTLGLSVLMGLVLAWLSGVAPATMVLATSPGGLSEMCITAKILKLGVPLVTSYQVARLAIVVTFSLPIWRLLRYLRARMQASRG